MTREMTLMDKEKGRPHLRVESNKLRGQREKEEHRGQRREKDEQSRTVKSEVCERD